VSPSFPFTRVADHNVGLAPFFGPRIGKNEVKTCRLARGRMAGSQAHCNADLAKGQLLAWQTKEFRLPHRRRGAVGGKVHLCRRAIVQALVQAFVVAILGLGLAIGAGVRTASSWVGATVNVGVGAGDVDVPIGVDIAGRAAGVSFGGGSKAGSNRVLDPNTATMMISTMTSTSTLLLKRLSACSRSTLKSARRCSRRVMSTRLRQRSRQRPRRL
jgi:hypothetical protein